MEVSLKETYHVVYLFSEALLPSIMSEDFSSNHVKPCQWEPYQGVLGYAVAICNALCQWLYNETFEGSDSE